MGRPLAIIKCRLTIIVERRVTSLLSMEGQREAREM